MHSGQYAHGIHNFIIWKEKAIDGGLVKCNRTHSNGLKMKYVNDRNEWRWVQDYNNNNKLQWKL